MSAKHKSKGKNYRARNKNDHSDFFPTYHALTRLLLDNISFDKDSAFLEPCAGAGDITKILKEYGYKNIKGFDINPRADEIIENDFLGPGYHPAYDHIITNPPFKLSVEFFQKSCLIATKSICMLWPLDYLHGVERYNIMYKNGCYGFYLDTVFAFVRRPLFDYKYRPDGPIPTGATSFAWFYFRKKKVPAPRIKWLHNNDAMGVPIARDQVMMQDIENT